MQPHAEFYDCNHKKGNTTLLFQLFIVHRESWGHLLLIAATSLAIYLI